jgi:alpha-2-macroglobulin
VTGKATPALIRHIKPEPTLWPSSALIDWIGILQNTPTLAQREALLRNALDALEARFTYTGKRLNFSTEASDDLWWMMTSADTNALRALLALMPEASWRERLPKLLSGSLARQNDGRWNTTTANAWGVLALQRYQQQFEAVKPERQELCRARQGRPRGGLESLPERRHRLPAAQEHRETTRTLKLKHEGAGQPYVSVTTLAAVPITAPVQRGYSVKREIIADRPENPRQMASRRCAARAPEHRRARRHGLGCGGRPDAGRRQHPRRRHAARLGVADAG